MNHSSKETGSYSEIIGYNANSSITDILRSGKRNNGYGYIDALNYTYEGNHLKSITDHMHTSYTLYEGSADFKDNATLDIEYVYDSCGSVIQDKNKEISRRIRIKGQGNNPLGESTIFHLNHKPVPWPTSYRNSL